LQQPEERLSLVNVIPYAYCTSLATAKTFISMCNYCGCLAKEMFIVMCCISDWWLVCGA